MDGNFYAHPLKRNVALLIRSFKIYHDKEKPIGGSIQRSDDLKRSQHYLLP